MRMVVRLADARGTVEGRFLAVLLSVLLASSFLGATTFAGVAEAAEGNGSEVTEETGMAEASGETEALAEPEGSVVPELPEAEDASGQGSDEADVAGNAPKAAGEADVENAQQSEEAAQQDPNAPSAQAEEAADPAGEPTYEFDKGTGTLTISNVGELTKADVESYLKDQGKDRSKVKKLVLNNIGSIAAYGFSGWFSQVTEIDIIGNPAAPTGIGERAFFKTPTLETVKLANIDVIGPSAFAESDALQSVSINNVKEVGDEAFRHDDSLSELSMKNIDKFGRSSFSYCIGLTEVNIDGAENNIGELGLMMFYCCTGLKSITVSNVNLGEKAFYGCSGLQAATLKNVNTIGNRAFYGCSDLQKVTMVDGLARVDDVVFEHCTDIKTLVIKDVDSIPEKAFSGATGVKSLEIENVQTIGKNAFASCGNVASVELSNIGTIGEQAFLSCTGLKTVNMDNVQTVGKNAFASCKGVSSAKLSSVDTVGQYAFYNCAALNNVEMSGVRVVADYAFWKCSGLTIITGLNDVTGEIGGFAFLGCEKLDISKFTPKVLGKMGFIGSNEAIMKRVKAILADQFNLESAEEIKELNLAEGWEAGDINRSDNWDSYDNGTQIMEQTRWANSEAGEAEVKVDAYYTGEKQMDYIFVADLSASMAQLGNAEDSNARFYDMQSKLLDMTSKLLNTPGYDCKVAIVTFGGYVDKSPTCETMPFSENAGSVERYIKNLEPLYENTDYALGLNKTLEVVKSQDPNRKTAMVFLSDGRPTRNGESALASEDLSAYNKDISGIASQIKEAGNVVGIYGVLHSPSGNAETAEAAMDAVCDKFYRSTNTKDFGEAMNKAFASAYGNNTVTIPVNADQFDVSNLLAPNGSTAEYKDGVITWTLNGMPFTQHRLTYTLTLKSELANRVGLHTYKVNDGDAQFGDAGAAVGVDLALERTVIDPEIIGSYQVVHEYYTDGTLDGTATDSLTAPVGTRVLASDVTPRPAYDGNQYELAESNESIVVTSDGGEALTLRYNRVTQPAVNPPATPAAPATPDTPTGPAAPANPAAPNTPAGTPGGTPAPAPAAAPAAALAAVPAVVAPAVAPTAVIPAATPAPAAAADADAATPAATIEDDAVPQASLPDQDVPLSAFDAPRCWVHGIMLIGIVITAVYGALVIRRRLKLAGDVDDYEDQVLGRASGFQQPSAFTADGRAGHHAM